MRHDWVQTVHEPGNKQKTCRRRGATRECSNMYVKNQDHWTPAMLDGHRQPFCLTVDTTTAFNTEEDDTPHV